MKYADDHTLRRARILVEQYVEVRRRGSDFVSTELACKAICQVLRSPMEPQHLEKMVVDCAVRQGLSVRFDRTADLS